MMKYIEKLSSPLTNGPHGVVLLLLLSLLRRRGGQRRRREGGLDGGDECVAVVGDEDGEEALLADHTPLHARREVRRVDAQVEGIDARLERRHGGFALLKREPTNGF